MPWPDKKTGGLDASQKQSFGKGVFRKCDGCGETMPAEAFEKNFEVCPQCGQHHKLGAARWRELLLDEGKLLEEWDANLEPADPLGFSDGKAYPDRVKASQKSTRGREAIDCGKAKIEGIAVAYGAFVFTSWAARWGRSSGRRSRGCSSVGRSSGCPSCSCRLPAGRACRRGS
jgi:acetyl-CoA carboxylase carboxyl transferase subunit beta